MTFIYTWSKLLGIPVTGNYNPEHGMEVEGKSDAQLVHQTLKGDENAFTALHDRYSAHVFAYAYTRTGDPDDAQTVVHDTFLKAHQNLKNLKNNGKFAGWMFRIALQLCASVHRERRKQIECVSLSQVARETEPLEVAAQVEHRNIEQNLTSCDLHEKALKALGQIPHSMQSVLILRAKGMRCRDIAQALGITENAVKKRLSRARKKVKDLMRELEAGNPAKTQS